MLSLPPMAAAPKSNWDLDRGACLDLVFVSHRMIFADGPVDAYLDDAFSLALSRNREIYGSLAAGSALVYVYVPALLHSAQPFEKVHDCEDEEHAH